MSSLPEAIPESGPGPELLERLSGNASERVKKVMGAYLLGASAYRLGKTAWDRVKNEITYTVTVSAGDELYADVLAWILDMLPSGKRRSILAMKAPRSSWKRFSPDLADSRDAEKVRFAFDGYRTQTISVEGFRVSVSIDRDGTAHRNQNDPGVMRMNPDKIVFNARSVAARDAVVRLLEQVAMTRDDEDPRLWIADRWGSWQLRSDLPTRSLDTVYLDSGVGDDLVDDLSTFLGNKSKYDALGIPWHRGYMFHGPPGTGKTSLAKAIATHFDLDVYYIPLSDLEADTNLLNLVSDIREGSVLLLEDIDVVKAATSRDDQGKGISLSALLNGLDGVATPNGLITVMTTNNIETIDEALLRPGRIDRQFEIGYLTNFQAAKIVETACGLSGVTLPDVEGLGLTPADLIEVLKHDIDNDKSATKANLIVDLIDSRA